VSDREHDADFKIKPIADMDVVIIGLKKTKTFVQHSRVQTVRVALMDGPDRFIVLGDVASGIDHDLGESLYKLTKFKIGEDPHIIYIQPLVVAKIEYGSLYRNVENEVLRYTKDAYQSAGWTNLVSLREPRLVAIRPDKRVTPSEVGVDQVPLPSS
jgi:ATP-dependent DNA ligase